MSVSTMHQSDQAVRDGITPHRTRPSLQLACTCATTAAAAWLLWRSGPRPLEALGHLSAERPEDLVIQILRMAGLVLAMWLLTVTGLVVALRVLGAHLLSRAFEHLLPKAMRRLVHLSFGMTLVGSMALSGPALAVTRTPAAAATTSTIAIVGDVTNGQRWPDLPRATSTVHEAGTARGRVSIPSPGRTSVPPVTKPARDDSPDGRVTSTSTSRSTSAASSRVPPPLLVFPEGIPTISAPTISAPTISAPTISAQTARPTHPVDTVATWRVQRGDHLWSIAERVLGSHDRHATEHEVGRYWVRLIDTNRSRLVDPANPDLIRVGQVLLLPALDGV